MSAWGAAPKSGAWATQVDEEEEENGGILAPIPAASPAAAFPALGGDQSFPSLGEVASMKETKKDRKKKTVQKMPLGAFVAAGAKARDTSDVSLPTAPRARTDEEEEKSRGLGGGFKNYGGDRGGGFGDRDRDDDRGFGRDREEEGPSRADAADDWGTKKAFVPSSAASSRGGFGDRERSGGFGDRERGGGFADRERSGGFGDRYAERRSGFAEGDPSRADDADRWGSKSFEPSTRRVDDRDRQSSFGSRDEDLGPSRADTEDRWSRRAPPAETSDSRWGGGSSGPSSAAAGGSRPRLNLKPRSADLPPSAVAPPPTAVAPPSDAGSDDKDREPLVVPRTVPRSNPFGGAKPIDVKELPEPSKAEPKASSDSVTEGEPARIVPKPRSNPFGSARPREEVLREKGIDPDRLETDRLSSRASEADARSERLSSRGSEAGPSVEAAAAGAQAEETVDAAAGGNAAEETAAENPAGSGGAAEESKPEEEGPEQSRPEDTDREAEGADASSKVEAETEEVRTKLENGLAVEAAPESASLPAVASPPAAAPKPLGTWAKIAAKPAPEPSSEETQAA